jgi:TetR/AcrR family transcriptional repressor of lmrAB and yxaGH operons
MAKSTKATLPTRNRILKAAKHLFQRRGYYAIGTAEILSESSAPKGSMYHHFPGGKEQIAIEAVNTIRDELLTMMHALEAKQLSVADTTRALAKGMAQWLKESEWREGTMLASTSIGSVPDLPELHTAIREAFNSWRQYVVRRLVHEGWNKSAALTMAQTLIAGTEGAMILARIDQDERIVTKVGETLATLLETRPS